MLKNSLTIGRLFGIPIRIHISWLLIFALVTWSLASAYFPQLYPNWSSTLSWTVGLATSLLFFISVLLHELGHSLVARAKGLPIHDIVLFIFGGVSEMTEEPASPGVEFVMAFVGPLTSFVLAGLFWLLLTVTRGVNQPIAALSQYLSYINLSLGVFNLIPGFPLDGGRVLRSILWKLTGKLERATRWAAGAGQVIAYLFILAGVWQVLRYGNWGGLWIAFIGWFLDNAAHSSYQQLALRQALAGHTVQEVMTKACFPVSPQVTIETLVQEYVLSGHRCFPVVAEGSLRGLVSLSQVRTIPRTSWPTTSVQSVMVPLTETTKLAPEEEIWDALERMTQEQAEQLPVIENGELVGMLMQENIVNFIQKRGERRA